MQDAHWIGDKIYRIKLRLTLKKKVTYKLALNLGYVVWKSYVSLNDDIDVFQRAKIQRRENIVCLALLEKNG